MCPATAFSGRPVIPAAIACAAVCAWVGAHTSQPSGRTSAMQFIGSSAACAT